MHARNVPQPLVSDTISDGGYATEHAHGVMDPRAGNPSGTPTMYPSIGMVAR